LGVVINETHRDSDGTSRVYTPSGRRAHTVWADRGSFASCIYCGYIPEWPNGWLGTGDQKEIDKALSLPYCKEKEK